MKLNKIILPITTATLIATSATLIVGCGSSQPIDWNKYFVKPSVEEMQKSASAGNLFATYKLSLKEKLQSGQTLTFAIKNQQSEAGKSPATVSPKGNVSVVDKEVSFDVKITPTTNDTLYYAVDFSVEFTCQSQNAIVWQSGEMNGYKLSAEQQPQPESDLFNIRGTELYGFNSKLTPEQIATKVGETLLIPKEVTTIHKSAFLRGGRSTIPETVKNLKFDGCNCLKIDNGAFNGAPFENIYFPEWTFDQLKTVQINITSFSNLKKVKMIDAKKWTQRPLGSRPALTIWQGIRSDKANIGHIYVAEHQQDIHNLNSVACWFDMCGLGQAFKDGTWVVEVKKD